MLIKCGPNDGAIGGTDFTANGETLRYGASPFSYQFAAERGPNLLSLTFHDQFVTGAGQRVFSILLDGVPVIVDLDVWTMLGSSPVTLDLVFMGRPRHTLAFVTKVRSAIVSMIDVRPLLNWEVYRNGLRQTSALDYNILGGNIVPLWATDSSDSISLYRSLQFPF